MNSEGISASQREAMSLGRLQCNPGDLRLEFVEQAHSGRSSPEGWIAAFPQTPDGTRDVQVGPDSNQSRAVEPPAQLIGSHCLAQDCFVHPTQQGGVI